jgi:hypothetical protein
MLFSQRGRFFLSAAEYFGQSGRVILERVGNTDSDRTTYYVCGKGGGGRGRDFVFSLSWCRREGGGEGRCWREGEGKDGGGRRWADLSPYL